MSLLDKIKAKQAQQDAAAAAALQPAVAQEQASNETTAPPATPAVATQGQASAVMMRMRDDIRDDAAVILMVSQIDTRPQARKTFKNLESLAENIKTHGQMQPVIVIQISQYRFELAYGERRLRAIRDILNQDTILARIIPSKQSATELRLSQLSENIQRDEYEPMELAEEFEALINENDWTHEQLAEHVHVSRSWVTRKLSLLKAPDEVQEKIRSGELAETEYFNNKDAVSAEVKNEKQKEKGSVATPREKPEGEENKKPATLAIPFTDAVRIAKLFQRLAEKHGLNPIEVSNEPSKKELIAVLGRIIDIKEVE